MPEASQAQPAAGNPTPPPSPQGQVDNYLDVKAEPPRVTLLVKSSIVKDAVPLSKEDVARKLQGLKVVHEVVDWAAVENVIANKLYDRTHVIASATQAKPGKDAWVEEKIKIDADVKPQVGRDGKADYRNVDNIHQVKKGDVLAVKHPAVQGVPGLDCFGKQTAVPPVRDVPLKGGTNTEASPDGTQLLAATGGYVYRQAGAICVGVTYVLKGDVDFTTGNLKYLGDITIQGGVTDGFVVEAQGDITVEGNVDAAELISRTGSVTVKAGIFGHGKGRISAAKDIRVASAQDIRLECGGSLFAEKALRNCHVIAADVRMDKAGATLVGGTIKAYNSVTVAVMGAEGCRTEIRVVDKAAEQARAALEEISKKRAATMARMETVSKRLKAMKAMAEKFAGQMSERSRADLKSVLELFTAMNKAVKETEVEKETILKQLNAPGRETGSLVILEKVVSGGFLELYGHVRELKEEDAKKEWVWASDGLVSRIILPEAAPQKPPAPQE